MQCLEQISYWCILYSIACHCMFFEKFLLHDYYYLILLNKLYWKDHLLLTGCISYWWMGIAASRENRGKMVESWWWNADTYWFVLGKDLHFMLWSWFEEISTFDKSNLKWIPTLIQLCKMSGKLVFLCT